MSGFVDRKTLFQELISHRERDLLALVTSTKKPEPLFAAQLAGDVLPVFYDLLRSMTVSSKVDLFTYSAGGQIDAPWPLVNLIREYYDDFHVLVPSRAHSAATLVALGADSICMGPLGSLSPIDPQFQVKLGDTKEVIQAGVEDIYGYYDLVKDILELDASGKAEALRTLAARVSPEILGKISRTRREIRIIAANLLGLHITDDERTERIVRHLVEELPSHQYMINRREATRMGLPVEDFDKETERLASRILDSYVAETGMDTLGAEVSFDAGKTTKVLEMKRAFIETKDRSYAFVTRYTFHQDGKVEQAINQWKEETPK